MSAKVCRWLSVRGRTYLTLTAPEVEGEVSQKCHTIVLHKGKYFTKKLLVGHLTLDMKRTRKRSAGKPHAAFDVAGAGNVTMVEL